MKIMPILDQEFNWWTPYWKMLLQLDFNFLYLLFTVSWLIEKNILIVFENSLIHKYWIPNDELQQDSKYFKLWMRYYSAYQVENSDRMEELDIHKNVVERLKLKHFVFLFKDTTFECIASSYTVVKNKDEIENNLLQVFKKNIDGEILKKS